MPLLSGLENTVAAIDAGFDRILANLRRMKKAHDALTPDPSNVDLTSYVPFKGLPPWALETMLPGGGINQSTSPQPNGSSSSGNP